MLSTYMLGAWFGDGHLALLRAHGCMGWLLQWPPTQRVQLAQGTARGPCVERDRALNLYILFNFIFWAEAWLNTFISELPGIVSGNKTRPSPPHLVVGRVHVLAPQDGQLVRLPAALG
jgi:hypothetical protein